MVSGLIDLGFLTLARQGLRSQFAQAQDCQLMGWSTDKDNFSARRFRGRDLRFRG